MRNCTKQVREVFEVFCPQCGHQQISDETRFCSRCGLSLGLVTDCLINSGNLQREKREITGIALMMATVLMLLNFVIVFGTVVLPHLANPVLLWIWLSLVLGSMTVGGIGLVNLIRGGFFKKLKERESRLLLMKLEEERQALPETAKTGSIATAAMSPLAEPLSVTETTTRKLR
jgi:hypothetical protein